MALSFGLKHFCGQFAIGFLQQNLYSPFRFFQLLLAFPRKVHAFFKQFHGLVQRKLRTLHSPHDFFKSG